jgi:hypothetical protein
LMSEDGRIHVGELKYVLHTNAIYKTGGTLYLGGFHSENYYTPDVPAYISFCCLKPSAQGGETGLINMEKVYELLANDLKEQLENNTFFVGKWLVSEVAHRYQISPEAVEKVCHHFGLPIVGENNDKLIMMYKPSVFLHPRTQKKSLQINFFELPSLNSAMRRCFAKDYQGKTWFWHRFVWQLPSSIFKIIELVYVFFVSFFYSPKKAIKKWLFKLHTFKANYKKNIANPTKEKRVSHCFKEKDVTQLAGLMRDFYSSCLWKEGDILLVDNLKVVHAGMPGSGARLVRALIGNPIGVTYTPDASGVLECMPRTNTIGFYMTSGSKLVEDESAGKEIEA